MFKQFAFNVAINQVSFGIVSTSLLKETFRRGISPCIFPISNPDISAQKQDDDFNLWLQGCINKAQKRHSRDNVVIKLWHISDLMASYSKEQVAITFLETDSCTETEVNVLNNQKTTFVTSNFTREVMESYGIKNVKYLELGFDHDNFYDTKKSYLNPDTTVWFLPGKLEPCRKRHLKTLVAWAKKYGNNREHVLHAALFNPFLRPEDQQAMINQALGNNRYWNINFLPYVKTNAEYNDIVNSCNIVLALSGGEGRDLPCYHSVGLGKFCLGLRAHSYLDYLNDENAVLIEPKSKVLADDKMFFHNNGVWNSGNFFDWDESDMLDACDVVLKRYQENRLNNQGLLLQNRRYSETLDTLLKEV